MSQNNLKMFMLRENIIELINTSELDLYPIYFILKDIFEMISQKSENVLKLEYEEYCNQNQNKEE